MKVTSSIYQEQQEVSDVRSMVEVYQEVAAMRMQKVKDSILESRQYYESLVVLVREVRPWLHISTTSQSQKTTSNQTKTALFFSANTGLYGDIIQKACREFLSYIDKEHAEAAVVGLAGKRMVESSRKGLSVAYFPCDDAHPTKEQIFAIVSYAMQFGHTEVFHGRFINLISQVPYRSTLSGDTEVDRAVGSDWQKTSLSYLFEPTTKEITSVVEGEILGSVVEQILHESNFSKFASRMMHLDHAIQNIDERLMGIEIEGRRIGRRLENKKQRARLAGRALWQT